MLLKQLCSFSLNADRAPQLKAGVMHLLFIRMKFVLSNPVFSLLTIMIWVVTTHAQGSRASQIPTVRYCDMITSPDTFDGKQIRLSAEYDSGFEHSVFADSRCVKVWDYNKLIWVEFDDRVNSNTTRVIATRFKDAMWRPKTDRDGRITDMWRSWRVNLSVVGVFRKSKDPNFGFGHTNVYPFMIVVSKIERVGRLKKL